MFFDLFGKNKDEFITAYAGKLAEAVLEDALDEDVLEELIHYAKEKDLSNKQLASAQAMACDKVFEELYQEGYMTDEDYELYQSLIEACYMMKEKEKCDKELEFHTLRSGRDFKSIYEEGSAYARQQQGATVSAG